MKVYLESITPHCPPRSLDAERLRQYFKSNKCRLLSSPEGSDRILLNVCACLNSHEERAIARIAELTKINPRIILTGCARSIASEKLNKVFQGIALLPPSLDAIDAVFPGFKQKFCDIPESGHYPHIFNSYGFAQRSRQIENEAAVWFISAGEGCEQKKHCSYCAVWKSIGKYKSKPLQICVRSAKRGVDLGFSRFHLVDTGAYGFETGLSLPVLLKHLFGVRGFDNTVISTLNPKWLHRNIRDFLQLIKTGKIKTIRLAHQSGSDRILRLMNREYRVSESIKYLRALKRAYPELKLITQVIVGFPSETEKDFLGTLEFVKLAGFDDLDIFPYSPRWGTPAYNMARHISDAIIEKRIRLLEKRIEHGK